MSLTQIEVECYAGAKADEKPRRFNLEGQTIEVGEVLDRWYQVESKPEYPRADYFGCHRHIAFFCVSFLAN